MKSCCITKCKNLSSNRNVKFYYFPTNNPNMPWLQKKRIQWLNAIKQHVKHPDWTPGKYTVICSAHFVGNKKSEDFSHPSYLPTIFGTNTNPQASKQKLLRWKRQKQRAAKLEENKSKAVSTVTVKTEEESTEDRGELTKSIELACQTDKSLTESCDPLSSNNENRTTNIKANIAKKRTAGKCNENIPVSKKLRKDLKSSQTLCEGFHGINSLHTESDFISITGVSKYVFEMLLKLLPAVQSTIVNKETKLLMTLMKLKTGLRYSALSVFFQLNATTIQHIFMLMISDLKVLLKKFIRWPSKAIVQSTMHEAIKRHYPNTRVIIDCTVINVELPEDVCKKQFLNSDKRGCTVKFLVGSTPGGFISMVSNFYKGNTSDAFVTNDCGLLDLLEPGDVVLADNGSPTIKTSLVNKNAIIVLPPFLHDSQFTPQEVEQANDIASIRIHIEKINQKIKNFHILDKLPHNLIPAIDKIVFVICALANLENSIVERRRNKQ